MKLNENRKKGCEKFMDNHDIQLTPKLYPPLKNPANNISFTIGENVLEYHVKLETLTRLRCSWASISKQIPLMQQKREKRRTLLWTFLMKTYLKLRSTASIIRNELQNLHACKLQNASKRP
jgi:hypothetical protein